MYLLPSNDSVFPIAASPNALANVSLLPPPSSDTCDNIDNCRTLYNIVWSCIVTIFACTWVAIHPNIPPQDAHWAHKLGRRVVTTVYAIIAPECVVLWAAKQWFTSRRLAEKYKRKHGWTQTHGFFTIMGGFVIFEGDQPARVLDAYQDLDELGSKYGGGNAERNRIHSLSDELPLLSTPVHRDTGVHAAPSLDISTLPFPDITSREIQDRSKGDWFSKGAAILQTSWFLVQCIARRIQRLTLTELELATCAFAVLNAVVYGLWWNKPKAVDCLYAIRRTIRSLSIDLTGSDARASRDPQASSPGRLEKRRGTLRKLSWSNPKKIIVATVDRTWRFACCWDEHDDWWKILFLLMAIPVSPLVNMILGAEISVQVYTCQSLLLRTWRGRRAGLDPHSIRFLVSLRSRPLHWMGVRIPLTHSADPMEELFTGDHVPASAHRVYLGCI